MTDTRTQTQALTAKINALRERIESVTDEAERTELMRQELELIKKIDEIINESLRKEIK